jgi:hypothetical protein
MFNQLFEYVLTILWFAASFTLAILVIIVWCAFVFFVAYGIWFVIGGIYYYIQDIKDKTKKIETFMIPCPCCKGKGMVKRKEIQDAK